MVGAKPGRTGFPNAGLKREGEHMSLASDKRRGGMLKRILISLLLIVTVPAFGEETASLRVAYAVFAGGHTGLWVAHEAGLFRKHGVEVDLRYLEGSSVATQSLLAGEIDVIQGAAPAAVQA